MGISSISNLPPLAISRSSESVMEPLPMQRVESSARAGDETYHPSKQKSSRGAEDGSEEESAEDQAAEDEFQNLADEDEAVPATLSTDEHPSSRISFLA
jgi:hypothetical protein